jgi:hypothetical protein
MEKIARSKLKRIYNRLRQDRARGRRIAKEVKRKKYSRRGRR